MNEYIYTCACFMLTCRYVDLPTNFRSHYTYLSTWCTCNCLVANTPDSLHRPMLAAHACTQVAMTITCGWSLQEGKFAWYSV